MKVYIVMRYGCIKTVAGVFLNQEESYNQCKIFNEKAAGLTFEVEYVVEEYEVIE